MVTHKSAEIETEASLQFSHSLLFPAGTNGITPADVDANGNPLDQSSLGAFLSVGLTGSKTWRHSGLNVNFGGGYPLYTDSKDDFRSDRFRYSLSANHSYEIPIGRRSGFAFQQTLAVSDGSFSVTNIAGLGGIADMIAVNNTDASYRGAPVEELYQNKTYFGATSASYIWQKSNALSFRATGSAATSYRPRLGLASSYGATASGDISYALDRNQTVGIDYSFTHIGFNRSFGATDAHTVGLNYSRRLGRRWTLAAGGGIFRAESERLSRVTLDPYIASILGIGTSLVADHGVSIGFNGGVSLGRSFRVSSISMSVIQGVSPGNGVYLASKAVSGTFAYAYSGIRKWTISSAFIYTRYSALLQDSVKPYEGYTGTVSTGRQIVSLMSGFASAGLRRFDTGNVKRDSYFVSAGLSLATRIDRSTLVISPTCA